jgi:hypothetical protein
VRIADRRAPGYVVVSTALVPRPSYAQISFLAPYSRTPSAYVSRQCEQRGFTPIQNSRQIYSSVYTQLICFIQNAYLISVTMLDIKNFFLPALFYVAVLLAMV